MSKPKKRFRFDFTFEKIEILGEDKESVSFKVLMIPDKRLWKRTKIHGEEGYFNKFDRIFITDKTLAESFRKAKNIPIVATETSIPDEQEYIEKSKKSQGYEGMTSGRRLDAQLTFIVIYSDIVGSTKTVKNLTPQQVRRYYSIFLNEMTSVINDFGGRVLKYVGDCIIGFFILPDEIWIPQVDRAFLCVKMMAKVMKDSINPVAQAEGLPAMSCRIGVDCGQVQVIKIGVEGIYTAVDVFGDVMNITKKICDKAKTGEIMVGKNLCGLFHATHKMQCKKAKPLQRAEESYTVYSLKYE